MDPFLELLPNEMIVSICDKLSLSDLLKLSTASSKVYQVCTKEIEDRKRESLIFSFDKLIEYLRDNLVEGDWLELDDLINVALLIIQMFRNIGKKFNNQIVVNQNNVYINDNFTQIDLDMDDIVELYSPIMKFLDQNGYDEYAVGIIDIYIDLSQMRQIFSSIILTSNTTDEGIATGFIFYK